MSHDTTKVALKDGMAFDVELQGHHFAVDAHPKFGGQNLGPTPKSLVLSALGGCTGMDVVSILGKMKMPFDSFTVQVEGDTAEEHPKVYTKIVVKYIFTGDQLDRSKIEKAVKLSEEKYCAVSAMLGKTAQVDWEVITNP